MGPVYIVLNFHLGILDPIPMVDPIPIIDPIFNTFPDYLGMSHTHILVLLFQSPLDILYNSLCRRALEL